MTLKIGTILIAKEDRFMNATYEQYLTKGNEYVVKDIRGEQIIFKSNISEKHFLWITDIEDNFTIKRYTISDLQEKKIAVFLKSEEEFKKISPNDYSGWIYDAYFGYENGRFTFIGEENLPNYILLDSIDEIDLDEWKEEVVNECEISPLYVDNLESEIARLKGENEELKKFLKSTYQYLNLDDQKEAIKLLQLRESPQISQDLTKRERMAWELMLRSVQVENSKHYSLSAEYCLNEVDTFLAKSKEVKP